MKGFKIIALCGFILLFIVFCHTAGNSRSAGSSAPRVASDSENVDLKGRWESGGHCGAVAAMGDTAYFSDDSTLVAVDFSNPGNPVKLAEITVTELINDITLNGNFVYLVDNYNGLHVIEAGDPDTLFEVGFYGVDGGAQGVAVSGNFAYVADVDSGLIVIDISDPDSLEKVGFYNTDGYAIDVAVSGNFAYVAYGLYGLRVIDISDPENPAETGFFDTGSYACGVAIDGNFAYVADFSNGLRVIDVSDPESLDEIGFFDTAGQSWSVAVSGNFAYVADKDSGLRVIEILDPENPREAGYYDTAGEALGVALSNDHIFVADGADGIYLFYTYLVAVLVQSYSATFDNNTINVEWRLSEEIQVSELAVYRREFPVGTFVRILDAEITMSGLNYTFKDFDCKAGINYSYQVRLENEDGDKILFETQKIFMPQMFLALHQNYPNPFNPVTTIHYYLPEKVKVTLDIYDVSGRFINRLVNCVQDSGNQKVEWTGTDAGRNFVSSGVYFCRLRAGRKVLSNKMILVR